MDLDNWSNYLKELQKQNSSIYKNINFENYPERFDDSIENYHTKFKKLPNSFKKLIFDVFKVNSINQITQSQELNTIKFLTMMGDPLSDSYANLIPTHGFQKLQSMLKLAFIDGIEKVENPPIELIKLYEQMNQKPEWISKEEIEDGAKQTRVSSAITNLYLIKSAFILTFYNDYAGLPMIITGSLSDPTTVKKRTCETLSFFESACLPGALNKGGHGLYSAAMVRFMHSVVRFNLMSRETIWNSKIYGIAIPKVDSIMAVFLGTLLYVSLYGYKEIKNNKSRMSAFNYSRYLAYLLGIQEKYIPKTVEELIKQAFLRNLTLKSKSESEGSKQLADAVSKVNFFDEGTLKGRFKNKISKSITKIMAIQLIKILDKKALNHFKIKANFFDYLIGGTLNLNLIIKSNFQRFLLINFPNSKLVQKLDNKNIQIIKYHLKSIYGHSEFITNLNEYKGLKK